jgi:hypothetical protein
MTAPPGAPRPREMSDLSLKVRPTGRPISLRRGATALLPRNPVTSAHGEKARSACCWPKRELRLVLSERWAARSLVWPGLNVNRDQIGGPWSAALLTNAISRRTQGNPALQNTLHDFCYWPKCEVPECPL